MSNSRLVYSSESSICPGCHKPLRKCKCRLVQDNGNPRQVVDPPIRISRESKGRKGKGVTLISGLEMNDADLKSLAKKLKALCGSGGTVKNATIEVQGDHRDQIKLELDKHFKNVKLSGG
ncbi:MAG: stress response translation initiation inhibitor YciH [Gammaproteobacteria bacterium]|jgi:translation initiation factor 1|nr:stress response translation initiation inhibitor YciH [Gammaproteobacteria bacterium]